jgi:hypothetical protein
MRGKKKYGVPFEVQPSNKVESLLARKTSNTFLMDAVLNNKQEKFKEFMQSIPVILDQKKKKYVREGLSFENEEIVMPYLEIILKHLEYENKNGECVLIRKQPFRKYKPDFSAKVDDVSFWRAYKIYADAKSPKDSIGAITDVQRETGSEFETAEKQAIHYLKMDKKAIFSIIFNGYYLWIYGQNGLLLSVELRNISEEEVLKLLNLKRGILNRFTRKFV